MEAYITIGIAAVSLAGVRTFVLMIRERRSAVADEVCKTNIPPNITVEMVVSPDGNERVRIFQRPEGTFGVCLERAVDGEKGWYPPTSPGTDSVYASIKIAKREVSVTIPWCEPIEKTAFSWKTLQLP